MAGPIRIVVAEDNRLVRRMLVQLLDSEPDFEVVGQAGNGLETVALTATLEPDVVLMDVSMPRMNGVEATRRIAERFPRVKVVVLSMHPADAMAAIMRKAGATAYLMKGGPEGELEATVRGVPDQAGNERRG